MKLVSLVKYDKVKKEKVYVFRKQFTLNKNDKNHSIFIFDLALLAVRSIMQNIKLREMNSEILFYLLVLNIMLLWIWPRNN